MNVLMLTTSFPRWQGDHAGWFVQALASHLCEEQGTAVTVVAPAHPGAPARERRGRLRVRRLRYFAPESCQRLAYGSGILENLGTSAVAWLNVPFLVAAFGRHLCRLRRGADVVHAHWGVLGALAIATRPAHGMPVVVTVHGSDLSASFGAVRRVTEWAVRNADAVTAPSREFRRACALVRGSEQGCHWIPNAVDCPAWSDVERRRAARPEGTGRRILSVGRLIPLRNYDVLVRAFARVKQHLPGAELTIVGDGPERRGLEKLGNELGLTVALHLPGTLPAHRIPDHLCSADLYVSPTSLETFGLAAVEAAAWGLPLVTTRVGFPPALVEEGETGRVVEPGDADGLARAMLDMLSDAARLRTASRRIHERVRSLDLTWSRAAREVMALYRSVTKPPARE